jgi:hypothetical protein
MRGKSSRLMAAYTVITVVSVAVVGCTVFKESPYVASLSAGETEAGQIEGSQAGSQWGGSGGTTLGSGGSVATSAGIGGQLTISHSCGDGRVSGEEKCDTAIEANKPGACPTECPAPDSCLLGQKEGTGCMTRCTYVSPTCANGDRCCPNNCTAATDTDCSGSCGDGIVDKDAGETCEPSAAAAPDGGAVCPTACADDGNACTAEVRTGSPDKCNVSCSHVPITSTISGDNCCPVGANANTDSDCSPVCGNGIREGSEECDASSGCNAQCQSSITAQQQSCLATYQYADADEACTRCMCTNCTASMVDCYGSGDPTIKAGCAELISCGYHARCLGRICYCGSATNSSDGLCPVGANGSCKSVIEKVAETTSPLLIWAEEGDPNTALGRSHLLGKCFEQQCLDVCFK